MNTAVIAVAGARKTQSVIDACAGGDAGKRRLVVTYTLSGQRDLERRLANDCEPGSMPEVCGWYSFLLRHWVRPFLPLLFPGRRLGGLNFEGEPRKNSRGVIIATGEERFLDADSRAYKRFLSKLAVDVNAAAEGAAIARLERMFDEIYFDEVQDLVGYDLVVLETLMQTRSEIRLVGDIRQSVFETNVQDQKYPRYRGLGKLDWFHEQQRLGRAELSFSSETYRSVQSIASFSDSIFDPGHAFPQTVSKQERSSDHDGVFAVAPEHVLQYFETFSPACLRYWSQTPLPPGLTAINFGLSKGLTYDRVLIFPTSSIISFLTNGTLLADKSQCSLYVAVTRAIYSATFVVKDPERTSLPVWKP